jgi:RNA polymerase sigma-70 factor (ECF subfamily)
VELVLQVNENLSDSGLPPGEKEFRELMTLAQSGDAEALNRICKHYEPIVRVTARVLLGPALRPHFDSIDLVQSVHRSLLVGLRDRKFDISSPEKLVALANAMVQRKVGRKWRKACRQKRPESAASDLSSVEQTLLSLLSPEALPEKAAEFNDAVAQLCRHLSADERRMLELRLEGYNATEVASILGMHPVAIRVRWTRLRKRLEDAGITPEWLS